MAQAKPASSCLNLNRDMHMWNTKQIQIQIEPLHYTPKVYGRDLLTTVR